MAANVAKDFALLYPNNINVCMFLKFRGRLNNMK